MDTKKNLEYLFYKATMGSADHVIESLDVNSCGD